MFVLTAIIVFDSNFYKGTEKYPFLLEIFLRLQQVHIPGNLILCVIQIMGKSIVDYNIDEYYIGIILEEWKG